MCLKILLNRCGILTIIFNGNILRLCLRLYLCVILYSEIYLSYLRNYYMYRMYLNYKVILKEYSSIIYLYIIFR